MPPSSVQGGIHSASVKGMSDGFCTVHCVLQSELGLFAEEHETDILCVSMQTPIQFLPEWASQSAIMLSWPHERTAWASTLDDIERLYLDLAAVIAKREALLIVCRDTTHRARVRDRLAGCGIASDGVVFGLAEIDDTWIRDYGPITVRRDGKLRLLDFQFNGWSGRYPAALDNAVTRDLHQQGLFGNIERQSINLVLEGGSIDTDGQGTLLTTSQCLLASDRNPGSDRSAIEARLAATLGVRRVLWLEHGYLAGDDTDGHVDNLARFCDPQTLAYATCDDPTDKHYAALKAMEDQLRRFRDHADHPYRLIPLPLPSSIFNSKGQRLPASYVNFLIINGAVLVPQYRDPMDRVVLNRLQAVFDERELVGMDCLAAIQQYGALHCLTMQLPRGVINTP